MPNLVLLAGLPGSGKTTWAKTLFDLKYRIVSSDEIRRHLAGSLKGAHEQQVKPWDEFYTQIDDCLRHDIDVIADATFLTRDHRMRAREVADRTDARLHLIFFTNWPEAWVRNAARHEDARVPDDVMESMERLYWDSLAQLVQEDYTSITKIGSFS